jgi:D-3-phosphoglycerate dehydrogenase / 2-oxoglutarate reductase
MGSRTVLVTDYTWPSLEPEAAVLRDADAALVVAESADEDELVRLVADADAVLTCFAQITERVVEAGERLQVIGRYGIGVDNIAVDAATRRGIAVTNVPAYCLDEVAEHTLALVLSLARNIGEYNLAVHRSDWSLTQGRPLYRVAGRTLGVVGYGKIGQVLGLKAAGLGLHVRAFDPFLPDSAIAAAGAEPTDLETLVSTADFLSVHVPLTEATRGLIGEHLLRSMKPTAFVINTARGGIIDQDALDLALREGWIAGAGIDVFVPERPAADHPLLARANLVATPHVAFYSEESVHELEVRAAENVAALLGGKRPPSIINPEVLDLPRWAHLRS